MASNYSPKLHHELAHQHLLDNKQAALWMGMGLGKTGVVLWTLNELFNSFSSRGALIVAPLRVCALTWPAEVQKWSEFSWMKVAHVMTKSGWQAMERGEAQLYVINWEQITFLAEHYLHGKRPHQLPFDTVVFDELTRAKSHESKRVNYFRCYINKFERRWGLTGTPAPNSLLDVYAQIRLLDDGKRFGPSFSAYRAAHFTPLDRYEYNWAIKPGAAELVHAKCADIALVLRSSDFLNIPNTILEDIEVPLPDKSKKLYDELAESLLAYTDSGEEVVALNKGVLVNKLLQVSSGAVYLEQKFNERGVPLPREVAQLHDAKIKALVKLVKSLAPEPVMISCQYLHEQARVVEAIPGCVRFDSAKSQQQLTDLERRWNAKQIPVMVAHPASIGHGLNLQQGGRIIVWFSQTYNREHYDQMNARFARTGQQHVTYIYRLICSGGADDAVVESLKGKGDTQDALLQAVENFRKLRKLF